MALSTTAVSGTGWDPLQHDAMEGNRQIAVVGVTRDHSGRHRRVRVEEGEVYPVTPLQVAGRDQALQFCFSGQGEVRDLDIVRQNGKALHRHDGRADEWPDDQLEQQVARFALQWKCELAAVADSPSVGGFSRGPTGTEVTGTIAAGPENDFGYKPVRVIVATARGFSG
jgi:hypothetical protein